MSGKPIGDCAGIKGIQGDPEFVFIAKISAPAADQVGRGFERTKGAGGSELSEGTKFGNGHGTERICGEM